MRDVFPYTPARDLSKRPSILVIIDSPRIVVTFAIK